MKILILRFSSIGDIVLTTPVIRCLKKQVKNAEIHYSTKKGFKSILEHNPYIDKLHLLDDSLNDFVKELQQEKFDYIIDLHNNLRTQIIKIRLGVKSSSFSKLNTQKWLLTNFKINKMPSKHIVDRYLDTTKSLGVKNDGKGLDYFIPLKDEVSIKNLFEKGNPYIAIVVGAKFATKQFPINKTIDLCNQLKQPIVLLGGKEDIHFGKKVMEQTTNQLVVDACGKYNLNQSASILQQSTLVISNDTGLMHIASALQKPIVAIWGNTVPSLGMYPYVADKKFQNIEIKDLKCRPCSKIGYTKCPKQHFDCMNKIDPVEIIKAVENLS